jgi:hypothetical protein
MEKSRMENWDEREGAAQEKRTRKIVEDAIEDHLRQQQLVARADLARNTPLRLNDVLAAAELQPHN